jgi:hypothetical protein
MEKTKVVEEKETLSRGTKTLFYIGWVLAGIYIMANVFFVPITGYGEPNMVRIVGPKYSGIEYLEQQGYHGFEILIIPLTMWLIVTFVIVMAFERRLYEKFVYSMQRIWSRITRRGTSNRGTL